MARRGIPLREPRLYQPGRCIQLQARRRGIWLASLAALVAGAALIAAGCGGGGNKTAGTTGAGGAQTPKQGKTFALYKMTLDAPDYFDPGLSYTVAGRPGVG